MATYKTKRGTTSLLIDIWIGDSTSTTGAGKTGLAYNTAGLVCKVQESDTASATTVSLASATEGSFTSGGFVESALGKGWYQFGIPNANIDSGTKTKGILYGATGMVETPFVIELDAIDYQDTVRAGLTALPNAAADAAGGLPISDAGGLDLDNRMPAAASITNMNTVFNTDFAANYNTSADKWKVDVTHYGGTAGTFSSGRPEVNTTHWTGQAAPATSQTGVPLVDVRYFGGTAGGFNSGIPAVNITQYLGTSLLSTTIPVDVIAIDGQTANAAAAVNFEAYVGSAGAYLSPGNIADGVWDEAQSGHVSAGTFGYYLDAQVSAAGGGSLTAADVWDYATSSATTVGSMGKLIVDNLDATITSRLADATYTAPDNAGIGNIYAIVNDGTVGNSAITTAISAVSNLIGSPVTTVAGDIAALETHGDANWSTAVGFSTHSAADVWAVGTREITGGTIDSIRSNTAQSGSTSTTIKLDASASATNNLYRGLLVKLSGGTGAGQVRTITAYNGTTKIATVDRAWITTPDNTSTFDLIAADNPALNANLQVSASTAQAVIRSGTAQSGSTSNTIKLDAGASSTNSLYVGNIISITGGTGLGQSRSITAYVGATKVATVDRNWVTTPDNTSTFAIYASVTPTTFSDQGVAQAATSGSITLAATASATSDIYVGSLLTILSGTAAGETTEITAYNGTTKVATVSPSFGVTPDTTSSYAVIPTKGAEAAPTIPTAAEIRAEIDANSTQLAAILDDTGASGVVVASGSKTGYSLASTGLDSINTTAPSGVASNFREMLVQVWRRFFKKTEYNNSLNTIKTYADDGTTVVTTQTATSTAGVETQGPAT